MRAAREIAEALEPFELAVGAPWTLGVRSSAALAQRPPRDRRGPKGDHQGSTWTDAGTDPCRAVNRTFTATVLFKVLVSGSTMFGLTCSSST